MGVGFKREGARKRGSRSSTDHRGTLDDYVVKATAAKIMTGTEAEGREPDDDGSRSGWTLPPRRDRLAGL